MSVCPCVRVCVCIGVGATGTLQFPYQRAAFAEAVGMLVEAAVPADAQQALAESVIPTLLDVSAKEGTSVTRAHTRRAHAVRWT